MHVGARVRFVLATLIRHGCYIPRQQSRPVRGALKRPTEAETSFIVCLGKPFMMFPQRLDYIARLTEARLEAVLFEKAQSAEAAGTVSDRLFKAVVHAALGGGKRFRPFLTVETAALFGVAPELSITAAAAVECLH